MRKHVRSSRLVGTLLCAIVAVAFAAPAAAKIVEFNSLIKAGLGDGGNPTATPPNPSNQPNGLPLCSKGLITHLNNSGAGHGFAEVSSGAAPQSIMAVRPFVYGTPGPIVTGPSSTFSMMAVPTANQNGAAKVETSTCMLAFPAKFLPPVLNARSQTSRASWPANFTFKRTTDTTPMGGMTVRNITGTQPEAHTLAAGNGPGAFSVQVVPSLTQKILGTPGPNTFGGGFRASGGGRVNLNVNGPIPGQTLTGYWLSGPRILGHNRTGPPVTLTSMQAGYNTQVSNAITQMATMSGTFTDNVLNTMILVHLRAWNMPFTTGTVTAEDHGGSFTTIRQTMGYDSRTPMGELGTLLLVSPWEANLAELGSGLYFGGTGSLRFEFLPEPGPTALFAAGVLGILAMHIAIRRRK